MADLVQATYVAQTDNVLLQFVIANNETVWLDLVTGQLDAILVHHIPEDKDNWFSPVALDGLAIIVHENNPVSGLTLAEVQGIFNGRISNWSALGGADSVIVPLSREGGAGTRLLLQQQVMTEQRLHIETLILPSHTSLLSEVTNNSAAIGYVMMGSLTEGVQIVAINGRLPTPNETGSQNYPLTAPLYFVMPTPTEPTGELRLFLAWLQSNEGQQVISERYGRVR